MEGIQQVKGEPTTFTDEEKDEFFKNLLTPDENIKEPVTGRVDIEKQAEQRLTQALTFGQITMSDTMHGYRLIHGDADTVPARTTNIQVWSEDKTQELTEGADVDAFGSNLFDEPTESQTGALRYNKDKLQWSLLPLEVLEGTVRVLMFGAQKYSANNWQKGFPTSSLYDSMMRHITAYFHKGEDVDPESGLNHLDHILCNAVFLRWQQLNKPELDDRQNKPE